MEARHRRKIREEWYGVRTDRSDQDRFRPVGSLVPGMMKTLGLDERIVEEEISRVWAAAAGPFVAQHSTPARLRGRTLLVRVLEPTVRFALESVKGSLLQKLQSQLGKETITDIRFLIG